MKIKYVISILFILYIITNFQMSSYPGSDNVRYIFCAKKYLKVNEFYMIQDNIFSFQPQPKIYMLLLSAFMKFDTSSNLISVKIFQNILFIIFCFLFYNWFKDISNEFNIKIKSNLVSLFFMFHYFLIYYLSILLPETFYYFFHFCILYLIYKIIKKEKILYNVFITVITFFILYYTENITTVFIFSICLFILSVIVIKGLQQKNVVRIGTGILLLVGIAFLYNDLITDKINLLFKFGKINFAVYILKYLPAQIINLFISINFKSLNISFKIIYIIISILINVCIITGISAIVKNKGYYGKFLAIYFIIFLSACLSNPNLENGRYLLPIIPVIFIFFIKGSEVIVKEKVSANIISIVILMNLILGLYNGYMLKTGKGYAKWNSFEKSVEWLNENIKNTDSKIMVRKLHPKLYNYKIYSDADCVNYEQIINKQKKFNIDYLILDTMKPNTEKIYNELRISKFKKNIKLLYNTEKCAVYEFEKDE